VPCGKKVSGDESFVYCYEGTRTCAPNGVYGECLDGQLAARSLDGLSIGPAGIRPLALGAPSSCTSPDGGSIDPCDPYCNVRVDDPSDLPLDAGFGLVEGGLAVVAGDGGGVAPTSFQTTGTGDSSCSGATNVHSNPCDASPLSSCQQDWRCDTATNSCVWNAGEGYYDPDAGGIDLTIGAGCEYNGQDVIPLCNRGSSPVPADTILGVNVTNGVEDACATPHTTFDCAVNVGSAGLAPGDCTNVVGCPVNGNKNAVVNAMGRDIAEAPGRCANNAAAAKTAGAAGCSTCTSCNTRLTGVIYDPRGVNPLPNVLVYVPTTTVAALPVGPSCDTCTSLATGNPSTLAVTNYRGEFTLDRAPAGVPFELVILAGKWRRIVTVPAITACGSATLSTSLSRLPRNKAEGNIPKMALTMASGDQLECLLRKVGVDDAEFTSTTGNGRIHLYTLNGMSFGGATNGPANLWGDAAALNTYDFIVAPCDLNHNTFPGPNVGPNTNNPPNPTANNAQRTNMRDYVNAGGRLFATHWMSHDFVYLNWPPPAGPVEEEFGQNIDNDREAPVFPYTIDTSSADGALLAQWAPAVGAGIAGPPPKITFNSWRHLSKSVNTASGAVRLSHGDSTQPPVNHAQNSSVWGGPHVNMYEFNTPWPNGACGRVVVSQSHVSAGSGAFPGGCGSPAVDMTAQEKAFEFLLFNATACIGPQPDTPTPPPPPVLPTGQVFTVDFESSCKVGERAVWQLFQWKASTPAGTSIDFRAATADTVALLPAAPPGGLPTTIPIGTANNANALTTADGWTYDTSGTPAFTPRPISWHLANDPSPAQTSKSALRVYMTFNTTPLVSPILYQWRQLFSCVPNE
jgi:hypothetical protein